MSGIKAPSHGCWYLASVKHFPGVSDGKESACNAGVQYLDWKGPLEKEMETYSRVLA